MPFVAGHCFIFCFCLLHFYAIITMTPCCEGSKSATVSPTTATFHPSVGVLLANHDTGRSSEDPDAGVQLERRSFAKEDPGGGLVDSPSDLDTPPPPPPPSPSSPSPLSENHVPPDPTEEAAAAAELTCPTDSLPIPGGGCECPPDGCPVFPPPPCMFRLELVDDGVTLGTPGHCCPRYECVGCERDEDKVRGRCQCAKGALIDPLGRICQCLDPHKTLVDGECVCDELKCRLPAMCNRKSVAVQVQEGCCKRTVCTPCPPDSESTSLDTDLIEDHCVCLPCHTNCGYNETVIIKKKGTGFPGSCCDLYECRQPGAGAMARAEVRTDVQLPPATVEGGEDAKAADVSALYCLVGDARHPDGATWTTRDQQICHCISGLSRCSSEKMHELENPCFVDLKWYANGENWTKEDGCTQCTCRNGEQQCISHFCEVKESHIHSSSSSSSSNSSNEDTSASGGDADTRCISEDGRVYGEMHTWGENGGCTICICFTGIKHCQKDSGCLSSTGEASVAPSSECQPLADCNKSCLHGYKINRRGCEICKCNSAPAATVAPSGAASGSASNFGSDLLTKYNISMPDLIRILDDYKNTHSVTTTTSTTTESANTATTTTNTSTLSSGGGGADGEDSEGLSSRIWNEVIRSKGVGATAAAPAASGEEESDQRRGRGGGRPLPTVAVNETKESAATPTDHRSDATAATAAEGNLNVIVACAVVAAAAATTAFVAACCLYRSRRKSSSVDLTRCRYEHVDCGGGGVGRPTTPTLSAVVAPTLTLMNNNNNDDDVIIKKTDPLL